MASACPSCGHPLGQDAKFQAARQPRRTAPVLVGALLLAAGLGALVKPPAPTPGPPGPTRQALPGTGTTRLSAPKATKVATVNRSAAEVSGSLASVLVTRESMGDSWPLTVDQAHVECLDGRLAVVHANGMTYALNGTAKSRGYPAVDPIWRANPSIPGTKINIGPLIDIALKQCK